MDALRVHDLNSQYFLKYGDDNVRIAPNNAANNTITFSVSDDTENRRIALTSGNDWIAMPFVVKDKDQWAVNQCIVKFTHKSTTYPVATKSY